MKRYRVRSAEVSRYPLLRLTFDDGLVGDYDLSAYVDRGPYFAPLADPAFFATVQVSADGRSFGWRLDQIGNEIDFGADAARAEVEMWTVEGRRM